jgi:hypothetical protein
MAGSAIEVEVLEGRVASPVAARVVLDSAAQLVEAIPTALAAEPDVYAGLQKLADRAETAIAAADIARRDDEDHVPAADRE